MSKNIFISASLLLLLLHAQAQNVNSEIRNGNKLYQQKIFDQSAAEYKKALAIMPENAVANYNLGNAQFRTNKYEDATNSYESTITNSKETPVKEKSFYNKGVVYSKQQKLDESIEAWKNALKLDGKDQEARENLQKALLEKKKQQQKEDQKKDKKEKKDENKDKKEKPDQKPDEQQSKLNKKQVEQLLKALAQKEKEVQQKMQARNASPTKLDKDW